MIGERLRRRRLQRIADSVPYWWHSIDLGAGVVTPGRGKTPEYHDDEWGRLHLPDLRGRSVLDIGTWDGYHAFRAERAGAARVVALDYYTWSLPIGSDGLPPYAERDAAWSPTTLPGKRGFDQAHKALNSRVEARVGDYMELDLDELGQFDVVLFLGVLYHLENPLAALRRLAQTTRELLVIESAGIEVPGTEHIALCEFYEFNELADDPTNWWAPNMKALAGMCRAAGFPRVVTFPESTIVGPGYWRRLFAHAWTTP